MAKKAKVFEGSFDAYTSIRPIGSGGSGQVFEVVDAENKPFALKLLSNLSRSKVKRFKNEIWFCQRPISKNVIQILDFGRSEGSLFYLMPLFKNSLKERIEQGIKTDHIIGLFNQILDGVEAAHLNNVYHRDLKPANLLCSDAFEIVVADFGVAHFHEEYLQTLIKTSSHERLGNFSYSAPEQRKRGAAVDHRADIFALGLILNEMFTGHVPQGSGFTQITTVNPAFGYLDGIVEKMIRQQPNERFQSIRQIKEELIASGHRFIEFQRLDAIKKEVVPETAFSDPIVNDPIRPVEKLDYSDQTLSLRLNQKVTDKWQNCFRIRALSYNSNFSARMVSFRGDIALLRVNDHFAQLAANMFKQFCDSANDEYTKTVTREHIETLNRQKNELIAARAQQERKVRVLEGISL